MDEQAICRSPPSVAGTRGPGTAMALWSGPIVSRVLRQRLETKDFVDRQDGPLARVAIVEAWNEWGEGYVGPHKVRFQYSTR